MPECTGCAPPVSQGDIWARIRAEALRGALQLPALRRGEFLCVGLCGRSSRRENGCTGLESGSADPWGAAGRRGAGGTARRRLCPSPGGTPKLLLRGSACAGARTRTTRWRRSGVRARVELGRPAGTCAAPAEPGGSGRGPGPAHRGAQGSAAAAGRQSTPSLTSSKRRLSDLVTCARRPKG